MAICEVCQSRLPAGEHEICAECKEGCARRLRAVRDKKAATEEKCERQQLNRTEIMQARIVWHNGRKAINL